MRGGKAWRWVRSRGRPDGRARTWAVFHHDAVAQTNDALRMFGEREIMRHDDHRRTGLAVELIEQRDNLCACGAVEIARGFIGKENARLIGEGARNGYTLLLAAGQFGREMVEAIAESDACQEVARTRCGIPAALKFQWNLDILLRRKCRNQLKRLENEPNFLTTKLCTSVFVELC
jgi:hypothetical protein